MNQLKRLSIISIFLAFFSLLNVSCFKDKNENNLLTSNQNEIQISEHLDDNLSSFIYQSEKLEKASDGLADSIANEIISYLQKDSLSFSEVNKFDIKGQIKKHAKQVLGEIVKAGIRPLEEVIASSVKPPTISPNAYRLLKPVFKSIFNKIEAAVKTDVPDSIWDFEEPSKEEENEEIDEIFD